MPNIWLYPGQATATNILLADPTVQRGAVAINMALSGADGADSADAGVSVVSASSDLSLSGTDGADSASAATSLAMSLALAAVDGADSASAATDLALAFSASGTDGADSASASFSVGAGAASLALDATDGADTADGGLDLLVAVALAATDGADDASAALDAIPAGAVDLSLDATDGADECSVAMDEGGGDNQTGGFRIYNLKRRKKRPPEPVPEGRWDITVSGPQAEVHADETAPVEPVVVVARDHSRWITVPAPKPLRIKPRVVAVKSIENDEDHALRLLLLLAS